MIEQPKLTRAQRASDWTAEFCGSWSFIGVFSMITLMWMAYNSATTGAFDPFPYILLNLFLTVISTFQSPLIMMSQNRQVERDRDAVRGLHKKLDGLSSRLPQQCGAIFTSEQMDEQISIWIRSERERCARVAESIGPGWGHCGAQIAQKIRAANEIDTKFKNLANEETAS